MKKSTLVAVLVFAALVLVVILISGDRSERGITRISFAQVDTSLIDRIVVTGKNPVELQKEGESWKVADGRKADESAVKRVLEAVGKITSSDLTTRDQGRYEELEVNDPPFYKTNVITDYALRFLEKAGN